MIAPVIKVATQTLPSPSTASESSSWKPAKSYSRAAGPAAGSASWPGAVTSQPYSRPVIVSATYTRDPSGDRPTPFGVVNG